MMLKNSKTQVFHRSNKCTQILSLRNYNKQILFSWNILVQILSQISSWDFEKQFSPSYKVLLLHLQYNLLIQSFPILPNLWFNLLLQSFPMRSPSLYQCKWTMLQLILWLPIFKHRWHKCKKWWINCIKLFVNWHSNQFPSHNLKLRHIITMTINKSLVEYKNISSRMQHKISPFNQINLCSKINHHKKTSNICTNPGNNHQWTYDFRKKNGRQYQKFWSLTTWGEIYQRESNSTFISW